MRCRICDFDDKTGNSTYLETDCASEPGDLHIKGENALNRSQPFNVFSRFPNKGGGKVRVDKHDDFLCSNCKGSVWEAVSELEFRDWALDQNKEESYDTGEQDEDDRDKAA